MTSIKIPSGMGCGDCKRFEECKPVKNVKRDTDACQYRPGRFERVAA